MQLFIVVQVQVIITLGKVSFPPAITAKKIKEAFPIAEQQVNLAEALVCISNMIMAAPPNYRFYTQEWDNRHAG